MSISAGSSVHTPFGQGIVLCIRPTTPSTPTTLVLELLWSKLYLPICAGDEMSSELTSSVKDLSTELKRRRPILSKVRHHVSQLGSMPLQLRSEIWQLLLQIQSSKSSHGGSGIVEELQNVLDQEIKNQRVIRVDVLRTRGSDIMFQQDAIRHELETLLTYYCKRKGCQYRQGLNEVRWFILFFFFFLRSTMKYLYLYSGGGQSYMLSDNCCTNI